MDKEGAEKWKEEGGRRGKQEGRQAGERGGKGYEQIMVTSSHGIGPRPTALCWAVYPGRVETAALQSPSRT